MSNDDVAGSKQFVPGGADSMAAGLRTILLEATDMAVGDPMVAAPVTLVAGSCMVLELTSFDGSEFEVFVRAKP